MGFPATNLIDLAERRASYTARAVRKMSVWRNYQNGELLIELEAMGRFVPQTLDGIYAKLHVKVGAIKKRRIQGCIILKKDLPTTNDSCICVFVPERQKDFGWIEFYSGSKHIQSNISGLSVVIAEQRYFWNNCFFHLPYHL